VGPLGSSSFSLPAVERALTDMEVGMGGGGNDARKRTSRCPRSLAFSRAISPNRTYRDVAHDVYGWPEPDHGSDAARGVAELLPESAQFEGPSKCFCPATEDERWRRECNYLTIIILFNPNRDTATRLLAHVYNQAFPRFQRAIDDDLVREFAFPSPRRKHLLPRCGLDNFSEGVVSLLLAEMGQW
jgi:hypothetical protein